MRDAAEWVEEVFKQLELRNRVLDGMDISVYVSDMFTNEILYANKKVRLGCCGDPVGRLCWDAVKGADKRCEDCPIVYLLKNPGRSRKEEIADGDKRFAVCDSIINWLDGRLVHLHYTQELEGG